MKKYNYTCDTGSLMIGNNDLTLKIPICWKHFISSIEYYEQTLEDYQWFFIKKN